MFFSFVYRNTKTYCGRRLTSDRARTSRESGRREKQKTKIVSKIKINNRGRCGGGRLIPCRVGCSENRRTVKNNNDKKPRRNQSRNRRQ